MTSAVAQGGADGGVWAALAAFQTARRDHEAAKAQAADLHWVTVGAADALRRTVAEEMHQHMDSSAVLNEVRRLDRLAPSDVVTLSGSETGGEQ